MRFHVVSLPHTQVTSAYAACAFTEKVRKFCVMMKGLGHQVVLYAGEEAHCPADELVTCISEEDRAVAVGGSHYTAAPFDPGLPHWQRFNAAAIAGIRQRASGRDFVCVIGGRAHQPIAEALPHLMVVEFGIGYGGTFAKYRVFESYAWMHTVYGAEGGPNPNAARGCHWFDGVIPGYFEVEQTPFKRDLYRPREQSSAEDRARGPRGRHGPIGYYTSRTEAEAAAARAEHLRTCNQCRVDAGLPPFVDDRPSDPDYFLFVGRLGAGKGEEIAAEVCRELGACLVVAGQGQPPVGTAYRGIVGPEERGRLMAGARALFAPTTYIEPFGNVVVEAMSAGTPAIATDWGAFTETVVPGVTGFRCRSLAEFLDAARRAPELDPARIRQHAVETYSLGVVARKYEAYFERLSTLWGDGWYARTT